MNRIKQIFVLSVFLTTISCTNKSMEESSNGTGRFSYKSGHVAFTNYGNNIGAIYYTTNIDSVAQQLTFPKEGSDIVFDLPKDLSKILYINYPEAKMEVCNICLYDLKDKKADTLLANGKLITSVLLSSNGQYVYFTSAAEIRNYSPIARKAPHGMDIFEITIENKQIRKLTSLNAYSIQGLTTTPNDSSIAVNIFDKNGLGLVSTKTGKFNKLRINSSRNEVEEYFFAVDIKRDSMIYLAPYELYKYNFKTNASEFILRCPGGGQCDVVQPDSSWTNILIGEGDQTYLYNLSAKRFTEVNLKIK